MRLLTFIFASLRDDSAGASMVSHTLLGMPTVITVSPLPLAAGGITDRGSGKRPVRPLEDLEAELRGAA